MSKFFGIDIFRKLPKELSEATNFGAFCKLSCSLIPISVSVVCTIVMVVLGISEIKRYTEHQTHSNLFIGTSHKADLFHANIDITFPYVPCDIIGLNLRDSLENTVYDYYGELHKHRIDKDGNEVSVETWDEKNSYTGEVFERALKEFKEG